MRQSIIVSTFTLVAFACGGGTTTTKKDPVKPKVVTVKPKPATTTALPTDPNAPLALSSRVKKGVLPNGLTYFVRANKAPEKRGEFWLVVNAGAFHEEENQRGLAHFVEHMAFNGTKSFPENKLISKLRNLGVKFGPHINAYTSFDETVYKLRVPTDNPKSVALALKILAEWAQDVTMNAKDVNEERGVVNGERRSSSGPQLRIAKKLLGKVFNVSKYGKRLPIGLEKVISNAPASLLKKFYKDWYHPGNMAVIAVGDFVASDIEKQLKDVFSKLTKRDNPRPQPSRAISKRSEYQILKMHDKQIPIAAVVLGRIRSKRPTMSMADNRRTFVEQIAIRMLTTRLAQAKTRGVARYMAAQGLASQLVRSAEALGVFAASAPGKLKLALTDVLNEMERARRHGFTKGEFDRATAGVIARSKNVVKEELASTESSTSLVAELVRHFLSKESAPGRVMEHTMLMHFTKTVTLDELKAVMETLMNAKDLRIASISPSAKTLLSKQDILTELAAVKGRQLVAYSDKKSTEPLIKVAPTPGKIASEKVHEKIGVTEWVLSNGARVAFKQTIYKKDQILMRAASRGGSSLLSSADLRKTYSASSTVWRGGLGALDTIALEKRLAGRNASVVPFIGPFEEGFSGSSSVDDFETMLQLVHLGFTAPRKDDKTFKIWRENTLQATKLAQNLPEKRFSDKLQPLQTNNNPRMFVVTEKLIKGVDLQKSYDLFKNRLQDASDFSFVFVGNFNLKKIKPLVLKYIGSLPKLGRKENYKIHKWRVNRVKRRLVMKGGDKARARMSFYYRKATRGKVSKKEEMAYKLWADAFSMHTTKLFREKLGATYGVRVSTRFVARKNYSELRVQFDSKPGKWKKLEKLALAEIRKAARNGVKADHFKKAQKAALKTLETQMTSNWFWRYQLSFSYIDKEPLTSINDWEGIIREMKLADLKKAGRRFIAPNKPVIGILHP